MHMENTMIQDNKKVIRAALYGRVSTTGHGQNVDMQLDELRQVAGQRSWTVHREYVDEGISGAQESRAALDAMLEDARQGKLDVVAVWKLDRLGRSLQHLLCVLDELTRVGVQFVSVRDSGIDTTSPSGRLLLHLLGAFAEFERGLIRERVIAGVQRAQQSGKHCGRPRVDMDLRAATILLGQGHSLREVADMLRVPRTSLRRRLLEEAESVVETPVHKSPLTSTEKSTS